MNYCRETLVALHARCAPSRDDYIDALSASLTNPPTDPLDLAKLVIATIRSILKLAETMKDDLSQFVLGTMGEAQLATAVADQAQTRERALVLDLWKQSVVREDIAAWLADLSQPYALIVVSPPRKWVLRVVQALGAIEPVACPLPTKPLGPEDDRPPPVPNSLPPSFFFSTPELFYVQNFLQAIMHHHRCGVAHAASRFCITARGFHVSYLDTTAGVTQGFTRIEGGLDGPFALVAKPSCLHAALAPAAKSNLEAHKTVVKVAYSYGNNISIPPVANQRLIRLDGPEVEAKAYRHAFSTIIHPTLGTHPESVHTVTVLDRHAANAGTKCARHPTLCLANQ